MKLHSFVRKRNGRTRMGKGFSRGELREAGTSLKQVQESEIPVDLRRRTKHKENVRILKQHLRRLESRKVSKFSAK